MPLEPANVIVVYRDTDTESQEFAEKYQAIHNLEDEQLVAIPCSNIEVLDDYATFQTEVEDPINTAMTTSPLDSRTIWAIVLMPKVPGGFYDGNDIVSSTSRLSRIGHSYSGNKKSLNPLYDRKTFKRFDNDDADFALICTRFDSPFAAITQQWFDNSEIALRQLFVTGTFYFDPFSAIHQAGAEQYETDLLFFQDGLLPRLGLPTQTTLQIDPYIDPIIPQVRNDSFVWSWGADESSLSYFKETATLRGFFYNADYDGAATIRDIDSRRWPILALRGGYVATAGHMSNPGIDGFLRPVPFFDALFRGASMGEAMLYSVPHLNWTTAFFGDPLLKYIFPEIFDDTTLIDFRKIWPLMVDCESQSIINIFRKTNLIKSLRDTIIAGDDVQTSLDLAFPINRLYQEFNAQTWKNDYTNLSKAMVKIVTAKNQTAFPRFYPNLRDYLLTTDTNVTEIFLDTLNNDTVKATIPADNIEPEGSWDFEFILEHDPGTFAFYHFELDISLDEDFDEILLSKDSFVSVIGWTFQNSEDEFEQLGGNGLTSNFAGKTVRYTAKESEKLERGTYYYFRIRQKDQLTNFPYRTFREIIYK
tara:strand:+ start:234281 stop:236047 length:1767 start_codon:yes stop_codon:yes gene_type:complete